MSSIRFHALGKTVEVRGSERFYFDNYLTKIFLATLEMPPSYSGKYNSYLYNFVVEGMGSSGYLAKSLLIDEVEGKAKLMDSIRDDDFEDRIRLAIRASHGNFFGFASVFSCVLNTAMRIGGDVLRLAARIHGQCELHAYIKAENHKWFASILKQGLEVGLLRSGVGWDEVISLVSFENKGTIVMSYSVCSEFPNPHISNWTGVLDEYYELSFDDYYNLSDEAQWNLGLEGLYRDPTLEINPTNWSHYWIKPGLDAFKLNDLFGANSLKELRGILGEYKKLSKHHPTDAWPEALRIGKM